MTDAAITKQADRFTEADIGEEIVVMRLDNGEFFSLSGTAAAIWRLIDGKRDRTALRDLLAAQFDGDASTMAADMDTFLAELKEMEILGG